mmetsp:Transcript_7462/g.11099  ORF Transcript_7462/g.11099 Transcript_7462/m.11099 type:complete len:1051 (-) Transcript_7462:52-3204(-)
MTDPLSLGDTDMAKRLPEESNAPRKIVDIRAAKESRTIEALKAKDEQIRILSEQNKKLLESLDVCEEEAKEIQLEKLAIEEENRTLRESNFEAQSKARAAGGHLDQIRNEACDKDKQVKVMTAQNAELLRLLETEEASNAKLTSEYEEIRSSAKALNEQCESLTKTSRSYEELANKSVRESQLQAEEIRLLKAEVEHLKQQKNDVDMKTTVEIESLQDQLRVRKEKQYQLLEKLQIQEEARRQAEDQVSGMEEKIRELRAKTTETETNLHIEINAKLSQEDANRKLTIDSQSLAAENKELKEKCQKTEQDRLRLESEARESGEQLREMAEKVFQLLERLKLAELGKTRSMEALQKKEQEVHSLKKKNTRLIKESTIEGKARVKAELDKKVLEDQIRALKKHNSQLGQRCKEEAKLKIRAEDDQKEAQEKVRTLNGRLAFLLNRLQTDEEAKVVQKDEMKGMETQLKEFSERNENLQQMLDASESQNRSMTQTLRSREEELQATTIKLEALEQVVHDLEESKTERRMSMNEREVNGGSKGRNLAGGRMKFFVESKPTLGLAIIKGTCAKDRQWLDSKGCNTFLRKAMKSSNSQEMLIQKLAELHGLVMVQEEAEGKLKEEVKAKEEEIGHLDKKVHYLHEQLGAEEESKRKTLLRYVNAVKASVSLGEPGCEKDREEVGRIGAGRIHLPEANLADEETYAIAAMLRGNVTIAELNLRSNVITDDGARAMSSILSGQSALRHVDLRGNLISRAGIKIIAEALERSTRVKHVYVHAGGKIEAIGTSERTSSDANYHKNSEKSYDGGSQMDSNANAPLVSVETVCVVDVRENSQDKNNLGKNHELEFELSERSYNERKTQAENMFSVGKLAASINKKGDGIGGTCDKTHINGRAEKEDTTIQLIREKRKESKQRKAAQHQQVLREQGWMGRAGGLEVNIKKQRRESKLKISHSQSPQNHQRNKRRQAYENEQMTEVETQGGFPPVRPSSASETERRSNSAPCSLSAPSSSKIENNGGSSIKKRSCEGGGSLRPKISPFLQELFRKNDNSFSYSL